MGNVSKKISTAPPVHKAAIRRYEPVETFEFMDPFVDDSNDGLCLNNFYFPEEVLMIILSYVDPKELLTLSLVCKKWCNIIKSDAFWAEIYQREYHKKPKILPWYVYYALLTTNYFDRNLIKNGNGENEYEHWAIWENYGDGFCIEDPPCGADPLPANVPEFNNKTSCFATSYHQCNKSQEISFQNNRLMQLIFNRHRPHFYVSEWMTGRFDCGCIYNMYCKLFGDKVIKGYFSGANISEEEGDDEPLLLQHTTRKVEQWAGSTWSKVELLIANYPPGVKRVVFQHEGRDTQFWRGHYGSKMAGAVVKILFDSIEPQKST